MPRLTPFLVLSLLSLFPSIIAMASNKLRVCGMDASMPHSSVPRPLESPIQINVPLRIRYLCSGRGFAVGSDKPLLVFLPTVLTRPLDYNRLLTGLARRGFVVAYPDYKERNLRRTSPRAVPFYEIIDATRSMGLKCPRNGQIPSASLINSVLKYMSTEELPTDIRRSFSTEKTVLFGHGFGGIAIERILDGLCDIQDPESVDPATLFNLRVACEQYQPLQLPGVNIMGFITFEGFNVPSSFTVPEGQFYLELHSSLKVSDVEAAFSGKSFEKRLASVLLGNANQYGPNNFVTENENQIPVCAGPPNGDFTTTRDDQNRVIKTIARLAMAAYKAHANGKGLAGLKRFIGRKDFVVEEVSVL